MNILETKIYLNLYQVCSMIKSFCPLFTKLFYFEFTGIDYKRLRSTYFFDYSDSAVTVISGSFRETVQGWGEQQQDKQRQPTRWQCDNIRTSSADIFLINDVLCQLYPFKTWLLTGLLRALQINGLAKCVEPKVRVSAS